MEKPNVLILYVDQLRTDAISAYGNKICKTPNLDALVKDCEVYENHFCSFPVCTPSRYNFLSGLHTTQNSAWNNNCTLGENFITFPKALKADGYATCCVGKMHMTPTYLDVGFDDMLLAEQAGHGRYEDDYHKILMEKGLVDGVDVSDQVPIYRKLNPKEYFDNFGTRESDLPEEFHSTTWIGDRAVEKLDNWKNNEKNLLMTSFIKPHHPFDPSKRFIDMYDINEIELLDGYTDNVPDVDDEFYGGFFDNRKLDKETAKKMTLYYYASITQIDEAIGKIIAKLKEIGKYENTMILFTADHGDYLGFHHLALKQNHMYDPVMRIPLIIKWNKSNEEKRNSKISDNTQILPTVLNQCGIETSDEACQVDVRDDRKYVFATNRRTCDNQLEYAYMLRDSRYKLIMNDHKDTDMLFDLEADPLEMNNVIHDKEYAEILCEMKTALCHAVMSEFQSKVRLDENATENCKVKTTAEQVEEIKQYYKTKKEQGAF